MLRHSDIWRAIDRLAAKHDMSASGLARRSGLDPTTFNKSKRKTREGKLRWPSTESIAKILESTGEPLSGFLNLIGDGGRGGSTLPRLPVLGYAQAGQAGYFDDAGFPAGNGWDEIEFPEVVDSNAYALEITGDSMEPVYREGDIIVISPAASLRRGDRVVLKTRAGEIMAKQLVRQSARKIDLVSLNPNYPPLTFGSDDIVWMARIIWASQ